MPELRAQPEHYRPQEVTTEAWTKDIIRGLRLGC